MESVPTRPTWASQARGAALASAPAAIMAGIVILIVLAFLATLAFVGVIDAVFILQRWPRAYLPLWSRPLWSSLFLTIASYVIVFAVAVPLVAVRSDGVGNTPQPLAFR